MDCGLLAKQALPSSPVPSGSQPLAASDLSQAEPFKDGGDEGFRESQGDKGQGQGIVPSRLTAPSSAEAQALTLLILSPHPLPKGISISSDDWVEWPL